jgi:uncharacterized protein
MYRQAIQYLQKWLEDPDRLPMVIRGARQVGKTWSVRDLAQKTGKYLLELNFEKKPSHRSLFDSNDPQQILLNLESLTGQSINIADSILFLDEIQAAPELLSKLRWFAEDMPELAVIAAGSLLEFTLGEHEFSMPVGRISYLHLEPLSFEEFLLARDKNKLQEYLNHFSMEMKIPDAIHQQLLQLFKEYVIIGGLPKVVSSWVSSQSLEKANRIQHELLATYRDDFAKYRGRLPIEHLDDTLQAIPNMLGEKFVYRRVNPHVQTAPIKSAVNLLNKARVCHSVKLTSANGLPLGAGVNQKFFKEIFIDVGLASTQLGLSLHEINRLDDINLINRGGISEQVVGQLLRTNIPFYIEPSLYYWAKEERTSNAEIDYIVQHKDKIIPIEVKSGTTGQLKSLHVFVAAKQLALAVRVNSALPSLATISSTLYDGSEVSYELLSLPFYLLGQLSRLLG